MSAIDESFTKLKKKMNKDTNNNPDLIFKKIYLFNDEINVIYYESLASRDSVNDFILEFFEEKDNAKKPKDIFKYIESKIPINKVVKCDTYKQLYYNILSGFTAIHIDGINEVLCLETRAVLFSSISPAQSETIIKGPKDAFVENYQINLGMIKKRIKSEKLWLEELIVGRYSQTKIGILYMDGIASKELVNILKNNFSKIDVDEVVDTNQLMELISENSKNVFPTFISTERPDLVSRKLLEGKIAVLVENIQLVIILPINFFCLFHSPEDYYQKISNVNYTRIIRMVAFIITILIPAVHIAMLTYNHEAIPSKLLINFSVQRDGVPLPAVLETILMLVFFEILRETDIKTPSAIGSSLSIVGALVLGEAAVTAGIVSPIMVIVIAVTSISGFVASYLDVTNGIRWWRILFIIFASVAGIVGVSMAGLIFIINICSMYSLGVPFLTPLSPFIKADAGNSAFLTQKKRFFTRNKHITKNIIKGKNKNEI
jgi:spore germination protein KA